MSDMEQVLNLDVGEETIIYTPNRNITHHMVRRTESGFEAKSALTNWREVSESEIRSVLSGIEHGGSHE